MSHFTVMVIGDNVEEQLAPYHEYECTGVDDEYVIDVDCTDEVEEWLDEELWVGFDIDTGKPDYQYNEKDAMKHMERVTKSIRMDWYNAIGKDLDKEIEDYFGYQKNGDGKYFQHTNPNAKWDWYQVGGRWSGFFKVKEPAEGELGEKSWTNKDEGITPDYADITTKGNIDIVGMQEKIRADRTKNFDHLVAAIGTIAPLSWTKLREDYEAEGKSIQDARDYYQNSAWKKALQKYEKENDVSIGGFFGDPYDDYYLHLPVNQARVRYVETAVLNVVTPFAFIKDGKWVERGDMGWWGMVSDEKDKDQWSQQFYKMFNDLPDDTLLTIVDCHI